MITAIREAPHGVAMNVMKVAVRSMSVSSSTNDFVTSRQAYQLELSTLRKQWAKEIHDKKVADAAWAVEERKKIVVEKAVKLREKRVISAARQEAARKARAAAMQRYYEKLAFRHEVYDEKVAQKNAREAALIADLEEESAHWITPDNLITKITDELFEHPGHTGLQTRTSNNWKIQAYVPTLQRVFNQPRIGAYSEAELEAIYNARKNKDLRPGKPTRAEFAPREKTAEELEAMGRIVKNRTHVNTKVLLSDMVHQLIRDGEERSKFSELLSEMEGEVGSKAAARFRDVNLQIMTNDDYSNSRWLGVKPDLSEMDEEEDINAEAPPAKNTGRR